jgi:hypothetical protein
MNCFVIMASLFLALKQFIWTEILFKF